MFELHHRSLEVVMLKVGLHHGSPRVVKLEVGLYYEHSISDQEVSQGSEVSDEASPLEVSR